MTSQTAREEELINTIGERKLIYLKQENYSGEHREWEESMHLPKGTNLFREIVVEILPLIARIEAEALARGRMEGEAAATERAARICDEEHGNSWDGGRSAQIAAKRIRETLP